MSPPWIAGAGWGVLSMVLAGLAATRFIRFILRPTLPMSGLRFPATERVNEA